MEMETTTTTAASTEAAAKKTLLILNTILLSIGVCGGPLIMRLYFIHGGNRIWLSSFRPPSLRMAGHRSSPHNSLLPPP
ncbi:hypothetical protein LXL04_004365 [Taraxacum kok-saghyz]